MKTLHIPRGFGRQHQGAGALGAAERGESDGEAWWLHGLTGRVSAFCSYSACAALVSQMAGAPYEKSCYFLDFSDIP